MDNIKLNGHWEDVETPYIKENGHWVASDDQYIKVGGHWSDTKDLSSTKLDYDMTIASEPDSSRYLVNKTATYGPAIRTNPIQAIDGTGNTATYANDKWTVHLENPTTAGYNPYFSYKGTFVPNKLYDIEIKVVVTSGKCHFGDVETGSPDGTQVPVIYNARLGVGSHVFRATGNLKVDSTINVVFNGIKEHNCDFTIEMEIKEILTGTSQASHKAPLHSGHSVALTGDGVIDVPINATLGSELLTNGEFATDLTGWSSSISADRVWESGRLKFTNSGDYTRFWNTYTLEDGKTYLLSFDVEDIDSGVFSVRDDSNGVYLFDNETSFGSKSITFTAGSGAAQQLLFYCQRGSNGKSVYYDNISIKEITAVKGSVTTFDYADNKFKQVGADGVGSEELVVNGDFSDGLNGWEEQDSGTLSIDNSALLLTNTNGRCRAGQNSVKLLMLDGRTYRTSIDITDKNSNGQGIFCHCGDASNLFQRSFGTQTADVHGTSSSQFQIGVNDFTTGFAAKIDNVSVKEILPLSKTYQLKDGKYGITCKLHEHHFSDADISTLNASPEKLVGWYFGTETLPSGIVKGADDKVYYPMNGAMLELTYSEGAELATGVVKSYTATVVDNGNGSYTINGTAQEDIRFSTQPMTDKNKKYLLEFDCVQTTGAYRIDAYHDGTTVLPLYESKVLETKRMTFILGGSVGQSHVYLRSTSNSSPWKVTTSNVSVKEITSDYLTIQGHHTTATDSQYGVQGLLVKENAAGVPTGLAKVNTIEGATDGRYVQLPLVDNTKQKHLVTKCLKEIKGDITQVVDTECTP